MAKDRTPRIPTKAEAIIIMLIIMLTIVGSVVFLEIDVQIVIVYALFIAVLAALYLGHSLAHIEDAIYNGVRESALVVIFNILIGLVIASWVCAGVIPYLIYLGISFLHPALIPFIACAACSLMSIMIGSSWTTAGTIGLAFAAIARTVGIPDALILGAVMTGAFFGDKQSPLSETTVFAAGVSKVRLMDHCSSMRYSTLPSLGISLLLFGVLGIRYYTGTMDISVLESVRGALQETFHFTPLLLILPALLIFMLSKKVNSLFCLSFAVVSGMVVALFWQKMDLMALSSALLNGMSATTGSEIVDSICAKGGINSMWYTICITLVAFSMSEVLKAAKVYEVVVSCFSGKLRSPRTVIIASLAVGLILVVGVAAPYVPALIMAACFNDLYDANGIDRRVLSRSVEDTTTIMQVFVPWSATCVFCNALFDCTTATLASCYFIGYLNPIISIILAITGYGVFYTNGKRGWGKNKYDPAKDGPITPEQTAQYYAAQE